MVERAVDTLAATGSGSTRWSCDAATSWHPTGSRLLPRPVSPTTAARTRPRSTRRCARRVRGPARGAARAPRRSRCTAARHRRGLLRGDVGRGGEFGSVEVHDDGTVTAVTGSVPHGPGARDDVGADRERDARACRSTRCAWCTPTPRSSTTAWARSARARCSSRGRRCARRPERCWPRRGSSPPALPRGGPGRRRRARRRPARRGRRPRERHRMGGGGAGGDAAGRPLAHALDFDSSGSFPFGAHVAVVEIDRETGGTRCATWSRSTTAVSS